MSLKCSVFGHDWGGADVTRDREEDGSEVVITITETETCERCGETRVVSENKEVTTLETPSDIDESPAAETGEAEQDAGAGGGDVGGGGAATVEEDAATAPTTDDAELIDDAEPASEDATAGADAEAGPADDRDSGSGDPPADTDASQGAGEAEYSAEDDDAVILEDEGEGDDERAPGQWPQDAEDDEGEDEKWESEMNTGELQPVEEEQPEVEPTGEAVTVPDGEFHCPECGFTTPAEASSLREGDFCPECHRGTLAHRPEE